jgi:hypothetical protein
MIFWQIALIAFLLILLPVSFFALWGLFTSRPRPGFWRRVSPISYWNIVIISLGGVLVSTIIIFALQHRNQQRVEERQTLQRIAKIQKNILANNGIYGSRADILARAPDLYRQEFVIDNADSPPASFISTPRCQLLLLANKQRGPSCSGVGN